MKAKLSERVRPNSEVLPWIYDEIVLLEKENEILKKQVKDAFRLGEESSYDKAGLEVIGQLVDAEKDVAKLEYALKWWQNSYDRAIERNDELENVILKSLETHVAALDLSQSALSAANAKIAELENSLQKITEEYEYQVCKDKHSEAAFKVLKNNSK